MVLTRFVRFQLVIFTAITIVALVVMATIYMQAPAAVGIGKQTLYVQLPETGGIYGTANVTYRGVTVGKVHDVDLRPDGVLVKAQINSDERIPVDVTAEVHSQSAIGEQYVDLVPRHAGGPYLSDGYTIAEDRVIVPQQIGPMIDRVDTALNTLEPGALTKLIDESNLALNGTGPALSQLLRGSSELVTDARGELDTMSRLGRERAAAPAITDRIRGRHRRMGDHRCRHHFPDGPARSRVRAHSHRGTPCRRRGE